MATAVARFAPLTNPANVPLRPADLTQLTGERMKGFSLLKLLEVLNEAEPGSADRWRSTLPAALRGLCDPRLITSVTWVPIELYYSAVAFHTHGKPDVAAAAFELGLNTARREIGAFFRFVLGLTSPATVLQLSGRFWRSYYDTSRMVVTASSDHGCTARIENWSLTDAPGLHELSGALVAWMEAGRAKDVRQTRLELCAPRTLEVDATWS